MDVKMRKSSEKSKCIGEFYRGEYAKFGMRVGRVKFDYNTSNRVLWFMPETEIEPGEKIMFSYRRDGIYRAFPGQANAAGLEHISIQEYVKFLDSEKEYLETLDTPVIYV